MQRLTISDQIRTVAARWAKQYRGTTDPRQLAVRQQLEAIDPETATAEDVARIIGNHSWACPQECDECGTPSESIIELGEEPDTDSHTARICLECLHKAVAVLTQPATA